VPIIYPAHLLALARKLFIPKLIRHPNVIILTSFFLLFRAYVKLVTLQHLFSHITQYSCLVQLSTNCISGDVGGGQGANSSVKPDSPCSVRYNTVHVLRAFEQVANDGWLGVSGESTFGLGSRVCKQSPLVLIFFVSFKFVEYFLQQSFNGFFGRNNHSDVDNDEIQLELNG